MRGAKELNVSNTRGKRLGILLTRGPDSREARWAIELARAAAGSDVKVSLFLMGDGTEILRTPDVFALDAPGLHLAACTQSVIARKLPTDLPHVDFASQFQLATIVCRSDRFVSFP